MINQLHQIPPKVVFGTLRHASKISKVLQEWKSVHSRLTDAQHEALEPFKMYPYNHM